MWKCPKKDRKLEPTQPFFLRKPILKLFKRGDEGDSISALSRLEKFAFF